MLGLRRRVVDLRASDRVEVCNARLEQAQTPSQTVINPLDRTDRGQLGNDLAEALGVGHDPDQVVEAHVDDRRGRERVGAQPQVLQHRECVEAAAPPDGARLQAASEVPDGEDGVIGVRVVDHVALRSLASCESASL